MAADILVIQVIKPCSRMTLGVNFCVGGQALACASLYQDQQIENHLTAGITFSELLMVKLLTFDVIEHEVKSGSPSGAT